MNLHFGVMYSFNVKPSVTLWPTLVYGFFPLQDSMEFKCKLCTSSSDTRAQLFRHYRLKHSVYSRVSPLPCLHDSCMCTFPSFNALKIHLSRFHNDSRRNDASEGAQAGCALFICSLCTFKQPFSEATLFSHLRGHLKNHEDVTCPFKNCSYHTNVYSSFNAHKSRIHPGSLDFRDDVVSTEKGSSPVRSAAHLESEDPAQDQHADTFDFDEAESVCETGQLREQLHRNLSSLFLKMQSILHVSDMATQEIVDHISQIFSLSQPLIKDSLKEMMQKHDIFPTEALLNDLLKAVMDANIFSSATAKGEQLSSAKRRKTFIERNYPVVKPVEYEMEPGCTVVYVPILQMIQEMFKHTDILDKVKETKISQKGHYMSPQDGSYFQENELFSEQSLTLPLLLYIDDLEIANPLGTSRKIHKMCSIYWVFADLQPKYRSALHVIQLAALCKVPDIERCGYQRALKPLLNDLCTLEKDGVFIECLGESVRGTVSCVVSDNLAAHALAGFMQSFRAGYICRFCYATSDQIQLNGVADCEFSLRTKDSHDRDVQAVTQGDGEIHFGVKKDCVLRESLEYFHPITGFPPDVLHDLFEGIVPVELALCVQEMIRLKYFTLEYLNRKIVSFPYQHSDKLDKPKPISKNFAAKRTIGGNGHENCTLLRLIPLMVGNEVPEGDGAWTVLMDLKEIAELVLSPAFDDVSIQYLQTKIQDHRQILKEVFPELRLRPKHHYVEHYPDLIRCFGPLVHLWTMRFEGKHRFFKRVVHDTLNFKNVLKTLATRHQHMVAFYLTAPAFFKPHHQTSDVSSVLVSVLPEVAKEHVQQITDSNMIYGTSKITVDGTGYGVGMFVSVGQEGGLPQFCKIEQILLINNDVTFVCQEHKSFYNEHMRSYELSPGNMTVHNILALNDSSPLSAYNVEGKLLLTPKRFILQQ